MKYLLVGARGQLGQELAQLLTARGLDFVAFDSKALDIRNQEEVKRVLQIEKPDIVLDAAAYTAVDPAEDEGKELNWAVNAEGTRHLALASEAVGATLIYVSTDYVFDGQKEVEYLETDATQPMNQYGKAKLQGEQYVQEIMSKYYIVRTSWVFGEFGNNFVYTMMKLGKKLDQLKVVNDQVGRPTWTKTLADFMLYLSRQDVDYGIYQLSNDGQATWFEFAQEILKAIDVTVTPVTSAEFPQKAYRPRHSVMSLAKVKATGFEIPTWQEALAEFKTSLSK